ncbi:glucocorticoid receptor-like protein [Fomitopsis schrenkii]|uniref:Glucocorticoid receptor-like protein n=1 Tax=Fomitopsis schrenkii TaxID=2126942 RepID=S8E102_FOMSC|nr:glucocorticoid receptor-like protein [Fomitopsis schrenkii]
MCGGCGGAIVGRTVYAMGAKWHPGCFRCCVCDELLENLSSYEHEGKAYCNLDYHELFAPKCYHCKTSIIDERFITLDDPELGKRTYHQQHFFCAECGDPFLDPKGSGRPAGGQTFSGDGDFSGGEDGVGFTVYRGHPYCEECHVRLRLPKCKKCKKPIRDGTRAVEALGGKYCWECFTCAGCDQPFENPSFFQRDGMPFCERCFSIMIKNEM